MAESIGTIREWDDEVSRAEQWIRQAGFFLEVSDELRPRVLEDARERQTQRRSARRTTWVLIFLLAIGGGLQALSTHWRTSSTGIIDESICLRNVEVFSLAAEKSTRSSDAQAAWDLADVFAELQHRRAKILDSAL